MKPAVATVVAFSLLVITLVAADAVVSSLWLWRRRRDRRG